MKKYDIIKFSRRFARDKIYIEIYINNTLLFEILDLEGLQVQSNFYYQKENLVAKENALNHLKFKVPSTLRDHRFVFFSCIECADIDCGALTIKVKETEDEILWEDFLWEDGYEAIKAEDFFKIPKMSFKKEQYLEALKQLDNYLIIN